MNKLSGKIALITGGTTGIGFATAKLFLAEGAHVIVTGQSAANVAAAQKELGSGATAIQSDTSKLSDIGALMKQIQDKHGRIDILFANAGVGQFGPVDQVTESTFDWMFDINVKGLYFTVQATLPLMQQGGAILLNASVASKKGFLGSSIYSATKAAVRSFGRTLGNELSARGIRVNVISPGPIDTPIMGKIGGSPDARREVEENMAKSTALKRLGRPEEIAHAALFLVSDEASYVLGAELFADGGLAEF